MQISLMDLFHVNRNGLRQIQLRVQSTGVKSILNYTW